MQGIRQVKASNFERPIEDDRGKPTRLRQDDSRRIISWVKKLGSGDDRMIVQLNANGNDDQGRVVFPLLPLGVTGDEHVSVAAVGAEGEIIGIPAEPKF